MFLKIKMWRYRSVAVAAETFKYVVAKSFQSNVHQRLLKMLTRRAS